MIEIPAVTAVQLTLGLRVRRSPIASASGVWNVGEINEYQEELRDSASSYHC